MEKSTLLPFIKSTAVFPLPPPTTTQSSDVSPVHLLGFYVYSTKCLNREKPQEDLSFATTHVGMRPLKKKSPHMILTNTDANNVAFAITPPTPVKN